MLAGCYSGAAGIIGILHHGTERFFGYTIQYHHIDWGIFINILKGILVCSACSMRIILQRNQLLLLCRIEVYRHIAILIVLSHIGKAQFGCRILQLLIIAASTIIINDAALTQIETFRNQQRQRSLCLQLWSERREACIYRLDVAKCLGCSQERIVHHLANQLGIFIIFFIRIQIIGIIFVKRYLAKGSISFQ